MIIRLIFNFIIFIFISLTLNAESVIKASDGIIWDKNNQVYTAEGDVEFKNDEILAYSDKIIAYYKIEDDKEVFDIVNLENNVEIFYNDEVFNSNMGTYDRSKSLIILTGNVKITSPDRFLSGDELIVDLEKNTRVLKTNGEDTVAEALIKDE